MTIFKLVECSDYDEDYGVLIVKNNDVTEIDIQDKIDEFKNSYKAYGYSSLEEMQQNGYETEEDMMENEIP